MKYIKISLKWLYRGKNLNCVFILAVLRWFTTPKLFGKYQTCKLCFDRAEDKIEHFFSCSGLKHLHLNSENIFSGTLSKLGISLSQFSDPIKWTASRLLSESTVIDYFKQNQVSRRYSATLALNYVSNIWPHIPVMNKFIGEMKTLLNAKRRNSTAKSYLMVWSA